MIAQIELRSFRGFQRVTADLAPHAFVSGTNSAGKSTILEAIALAEGCLRLARRQHHQVHVSREGLSLPGYRLPTSSEDEEDPVRHEFRNDETSITARWTNGARIEIVWPDATFDQASFFVLFDESGRAISTPGRVRTLFSQVVPVPVITPLDRAEQVKDSKYIAKHSGGRLASRHFRNHLWRLSETPSWDAFRQFCEEWLPEMRLEMVDLDVVGNRISVFYREPGSRTPKELSWSGDGLQIFIQLLWHLYSARDAGTIILDEPEVYLHPSLQKRLVALLNSLPAQIVIASHSSNILTAAPPNCILHVDRRRNLAVRTNSLTEYSR
ncbi:MAG: AAA family ATPase [Devosia sp.]